MAVHPLHRGNGQRSNSSPPEGSGRPRMSSASPPLDPMLEVAKAYLQMSGYDVRKKDNGRFGKPRSFVRMLQCISDSKDGSKNRDALTELEKDYSCEWLTTKAAVVKGPMGETSGAGGGYLVPLDYTMKLMETVAEENFIYPRANVIPMASEQMQVPRIDVETAPTSAGQSSFFGGLVFSWGMEDAPTETESRFRGMALNAWDLLGYSVVSNLFIQDIGPGGEDYLLKLFGRAAAWYTEFAFLSGTGSAAQMPLGVLNAPALTTFTRAGGGTIAATDVAGMASKLLPYSWRHGIWVTHPTALAKIFAIGSYYLNAESDSNDGRCGSLMGRPLFASEKVTTLGAQGDLLLFDPSLYTVGDRQQVLIDVSPHPGFRNYQTDYRVWLRVDGKPQLSGPVTLQDGTVVSPYVALK